jgi:small-conductance mechanosensitive channel
MYVLPLLGNAAVQWLVAFGLSLGCFAALMTARRIARGYHQRLLATERTEIIEIPLHVVARTTALFIVALSLFLGAQALTQTPRVARIIDSAITIALFWQAGVWAVAGTSAWIDRKRRASMTADRAMVGTLGILGFMVNVLIWSLVVLLTLDNVGVDITALVAGLGIGGIAVALAVQNILGDLFASLSITLDRPFVVGDFLSVGDFLGSVEHIGIKSTRLRSLSGEQIVMPNADLLGSRVRNYGRMSERRVVFTIRVTYQTPVALVERIPGLIRRIIEAQDDTRFDRSHFAKHAETSLEFETVYYVLSPNYNRYMDIQQEINLRLHREFAHLGVEFAYPTRKVFVARAPRPAYGERNPEPAQPTSRASPSSDARAA